ncbi:MAG: sporulation protein YhbH [Tuberibacillus sp.]
MKSYLISEENWDLHRKGFQDQHRHMEKVKEAIKDNLPDLISEESIILTDGKGITRIPIRSLDQYKIRYSQDDREQVGQGNGNSKVGDVIAKLPPQPGRGNGKGQKAGDRPGVDYYEADVSLMDIEEVFFRELELPHLKEKEDVELVVDHIDFRDIRRKGLIGNVDKRKTILAALKRNAMKGKPGINPITEEDLRFKTWDTHERRESKAVVFALMDTSGSMGVWEKYVARSFYFWMTRFLRTKYETVDIVFIAHHTEAKIVTEDEFFNRGESGGTICSSAYKMALELVGSKFSPERYNIYPVHFSDGDNLSSDNKRCVDLVKELLTVSSCLFYGEINPYNRRSTLMNVFQEIHDDHFRKYILKQKSDVYEAMKKFFSNNSPAISAS